MRLTRFRFSIRGFMVALALATVLTAGGVQALRWGRLRADYLQQVAYHRGMLEDAEELLAEAEAVSTDPDEQALLARLPEERAKWDSLVDQNRRRIQLLTAAVRRWQRLADRPWEPRPADLYRVD